MAFLKSVYFISRHVSNNKALLPRLREIEVVPEGTTDSSRIESNAPGLRSLISDKEKEGVAFTQ
jgi:hypothetical protein